MTQAQELAQAFVDHLDDSRAQSADLDALGRALTNVFAVSTKRWDPVVVSPAAFAVYMAERLPEGDLDLVGAVESMHGESLYLACACAAGDQTAVEIFEHSFFGLVPGVLRRLDRTGEITDEATQRLRERLFVAKAGEPPRVTTYAGRGDLRKWVRAAAVRLALDLLRVEKREQRRREADDVLDALPDSSSDPELAHIREHYGSLLRETFAGVVDSLPDRDKSVLRYHFVDRLTIDQIGSIYQVHKTTAFRWLEKARAFLARETRARLRDSLGVGNEELASIMRLLDSDLHLSIQRLLGT